MYLSRVELDTARRDTMALFTAPQKMHGAIESSFPGERRRRLWRLDSLGGKWYLLLLSEERPDLNRVVSQFGVGVPAETRDYEPLLQRIQPGSVWRFRLTANPTRSSVEGVERDANGRPGRGKVQACGTAELQREWLRRQAEKRGFTLREGDFDVTASRWLRFSKGRDSGREVSLLSVTYEGLLQVADADAFYRLLTEGMGRGKAYGLGLMTVVRPGAAHG